MRTKTRDGLLEGLLEEPSQPAPAIAQTSSSPWQLEPAAQAVGYAPAAPAQEKAAPRPASRPTRKAPPAFVGDLYSRLGRSIALLGFTLLSGFLWYAGAYFTLAFLERWYPVSSLGLAQWLIPLAITATEIFLWPQRASWPQRIGFWSVLLFDIGTTYSGLLPLIAGRRVDIFGSHVIPEAGAVLYAIGILSGLLLAYGPEKLGKWALSELYALWR